MARSFWKGAISFGMVSIPVRMSLATVSRTPSFHLLHQKCLTRPKQVLYCEQDDEYFSSKETVRGYEYAKDQYVVMDDSDFEKVPVKTTHTIEILAFVKEAEIDPIYFFNSHYLEPEDIVAKPYGLLREAMRQTGRAALVKVAFQHREHLGCLRPSGALLVLHTMHFADEIVPPGEITVPERKFTADELKMADSLIEAMGREFKPEDYHDDYSQALEDIVKAKASGQEIEVMEMPKYEEIPDLMSALKASIEAATRESATRPKAATGKAKTSKK